MSFKNNRTIYVGNLPDAVNDQLLIRIFGNFGQCISCHIIRDFSCQTNPYAFIEYTDHSSASLALSAMDGIYMWNNQIKVNWSSGPSAVPGPAAVASAKIDYSNSVQIFVGDIGLDVDEPMLKEGFSQFGQLIDAKVVRYPDGQSRGFAFVSFSNRDEAERAIQSMHKTWFHNRTIKCNWATRNGLDGEQFIKYTPRPYELVYKEAPLTNTNVYVAGENLTEELLNCHFQEFGRIDSVKVYPEKGHAFINFVTHEAAARAISQRHGYKINDNVIKCNWGKENFGISTATIPALQPAMASAFLTQTGALQPPPFYTAPPTQPFYQ
uniref:TIA1-like protein n=1 Tax=Dugesia japonica TaxID=6161 RepID=D5JG77_DUGJA|nr:TIA1-like protein [Dugesia japonica]